MSRPDKRVLFIRCDDDLISLVDLLVLEDHRRDPGVRFSRAGSVRRLLYEVLEERFGEEARRARVNATIRRARRGRLEFVQREDEG